MDSIVSANSIKDKNLIYAGDTLNIPETTEIKGTPDYTISQLNGKNDDSLKNDVASDYEKWKKSKAPSYNGSVKNDIDSALKELSEREFSYSPEEDEAYVRYRNSVKNTAELALADALGLASTLNGGYSTSYAQLAGQSAYVNAMSDADEMIPELYKAAYDRYADETDNIEDKIDILRDLDNDEWDRYVDMLDAYNEEGERLFDQLNELSNEEFDRFYAMYKLSVK